jgi:hypothetical protein
VTAANACRRRVFALIPFRIFYDGSDTARTVPGSALPHRASGRGGAT